MHQKIIFTNSKEKSDFLTVSPKNFRIGRYNLEYLDYTINFKKKLELSDFEGISFLDHFSFNEISTWWLMHERFFYTIQPIINFIVFFENFLKEHEPTIIEIKDHFEYFKLIEQICKKHKILLEYDDLSFQKFKLKQKLKKTVRNTVRKNRLSKLTSNRIQNHMLRFNKKYENIPSIKNKIVFATPVTYRRLIYNHKTNLFERGDYLTTALMQFFKNTDNHLGLSLPFTTDMSFDMIYEERLKDQMIWLPEELFLKKSVTISKFLEKYKRLIDNKNFQNLFSFHEINFWDSIIDMFFQMTFSPYLPYWLSLYLGYCDKFEFEKPKSIFMPSEIDPQNQILIFACKKYEIPTVGLQQGFFSLAGPPGFFHDSALHSHKFGYPFPSKLFVWGDISKQILIKLGWPASCLIVFGHIYYHNLNQINELLKNPPFSKFNIDSSKKIILFPTTEMQSMYSFPGYVYDTTVWKYLLKKFSNNNNFIIILKPHPNENILEYEQILKESNSKNSFIIQDNLQELLSISDLIISNHSTVILDAVAMKKPILNVEWNDIDENLSQYTTLIESTELKYLKENILKILDNYIFDSTEWTKTMHDFFNIPLDESKIGKLLKNI